MIKEFKRFIDDLKKKKGNDFLYRSGWELGNQDRDLLFYSNSIINATPYLEQGTSNTSGIISDRISSAEAVKLVKSGDERIIKKPVEVFKEILTEIPKMNMADLDVQIAVVERRMHVLKNTLGMDNAMNDENEALSFLRARKKYDKVKDNMNWAMATLPSVDALVKKYKLRLVSFEGYYKSVPMEAIHEIEKYIKVWERVRDDKPLLKLIIDEGGKEEKKDPILLASSPFGKHWYVLGAWDKEVIYVDDIVYNGK